MLDAGKLDRRIDLLRATYATNDANESIATWGVLASRAAKADAVSDGERLRAQEVGAIISMRFKVRWSSDIADLDPTDRVEYEGRPYDIVAVKEIGRREYLEITAAARAERVD